MKKTQILFTAILLTIFNFSFAQKNETIFFEKNDFELSNPEKQKLNKFLNSLNLKENEIIEIKGFTDSDGNSEFNMKLSENRVKSVEKFLLSQNVKAEKIKLNFFGETNPAASNLEEAGKQKNRRVEIRVFNPSEKNLSIYARFKKKPQIFVESAKENIEIKGEEGTIIKIPKYSLMSSKNRTITGEVEISLEEYYKNSDIIKANLHTLSDNQILETGGMINIVIKYQNEELKLRKDSEIQIEFANDDMERMETFLGETKNGKFNWNLKKAVIPEPENMINKSLGDTIFLDGISKADTIKQKNVVNKYLTSNKLNWINCDRFLNTKKEDLTNLGVRTNIAPAEVKLVFKKINSIMSPVNFQDSLFEFINLPRQSKTTIIAFTEIDGEPYYASKEITIGQKQVENLTLTKISWEQLDKEFKILDSPNRNSNNYNIQID